jgi:hypothetical protein
VVAKILDMSVRLRVDVDAKGDGSKGFGDCGMWVVFEFPTCCVAYAREVNDDLWLKCPAQPRARCFVFCLSGREALLLSLQ